MRRLSAGNYEIVLGSTLYSVQKCQSDYGDVQWIIDRMDLDTHESVCPWGQADTKGEAVTQIFADFGTSHA